MNKTNNPEAKIIKLLYLIGTYPGLTNTFIDQEIATLRKMENFKIQIVAIRSPRAVNGFSPEQKALNQETLHLIPSSWLRFNYLKFILANIYFMFSKPIIYFGTFFDFIFHADFGIQGRLMAVLYFWQGVYAAYLLRGMEFDHLHVHFMDRAVLVALVAGRFLGKSYSFTAHAADIYTRANLARQKIDNASFVITVSNYNKEQLLKFYPGISEAKIHILHPWVDVNRFEAALNRSIHKPLRILSVGRLVEKKGHVDLIAAAAILQSKGFAIDCQIVGDGPLFAALSEQIAGLGLQDSVHLLGGQPQEKVLNLLREWADVFVLPCVIAQDGDRDGIPVSLAEAMAMELPVVSTDIVGIRELIQPGTGILIPPHDPPALAEAIREIAVMEPQAFASMGRKGRAVINHEFNLDKGTRQLAVYFSTTVQENMFTKKEMVENVTNFTS